MAIQRRETTTGKVRWVARWRDKGGKEHSRSFDTKREAKAFLAEVEHRATRGVDTIPQRTTVRDVFDGWLATRDVREGTRAAYKDVRDRQLKPPLVELADTPHSKCGAKRRVGSSPTSGTVGARPPAVCAVSVIDRPELSGVLCS